MRRDRGGYTLLEVSVVSVLMAIALLGGIATLRQATGLFRQSAASGDVSIRVTRATNRIVRELMAADAGGLAPDLTPPAFGPYGGSDRLDFQVPTGWTAGAATWGPLRRIGFEQELGEPLNGIDDDGDGTVDEGAVVLVEDLGGPRERRVVLLNGVTALQPGEVLNGLDDNGNGLVDERGLSFDALDGVLTMRLSVQELGPSRQMIVRTIEAQIELRN